jgi:predicted hydrocarbon binding protein
MTISRKQFFKTACLGGACLCGFSAIAGSAPSENENQTDDYKALLFQNWIALLLTNIDSSLGEDEIRKVLKSSALAHYNDLKMESILEGYKDKLETFIGWVETSWGWKVDYNKATRTIVADENKNYCVCPMIDHKTETRYPALCYCSEGFAEKMFSTVIGQPVSATVISSVQRGAKSCKYRITF